MRAAGLQPVARSQRPLISIQMVIAIVGAGDLGGALASTLAARGRVREIRLIDEAGTAAAGKALDVQQSTPVHGTAVACRDTRPSTPSTAPTSSSSPMRSVRRRASGRARRGSCSFAGLPRSRPSAPTRARRRLAGVAGRARRRRARACRGRGSSARRPRPSPPVCARSSGSKPARRRSTCSSPSPACRRITSSSAGNRASIAGAPA